MLPQAFHQSQNSKHNYQVAGGQKKPLERSSGILVIMTPQSRVVSGYEPA